MKIKLLIISILFSISCSGQTTKQDSSIINIDSTCQNRDQINIPDGHYNASWSAYYLKAKINGKIVTIRTRNGIRTINVSTIICVRNNCIVEIIY